LFPCRSYAFCTEKKLGIFQNTIPDIFGLNVPQGYWVVYVISLENSSSILERLTKENSGLLINVMPVSVDHPYGFIEDIDCLSLNYGRFYKENWTFFVGIRSGVSDREIFKNEVNQFEAVLPNDVKLHMEFTKDIFGLLVPTFMLILHFKSDDELQKLIDFIQHQFPFNFIINPNLPTLFPTNPIIDQKKISLKQKNDPNNLLNPSKFSLQ